MKKQLEAEVKVGIFVSIGIGLIMLSVLVLGGNTIFTSANRYTAHFGNVDGLVVGAKVTLGGVPVGTVEKIGFDFDKRNIQVTITVDKQSSEWVREDSTVEVATQGVLGDKYISINVGSKDKPLLKSGDDISIRATRDLTQFLSKGDQLMVSLNGIASSLDRILKHFEADNRSETFFKGISSTAKNMSMVSEKLNRELDQIQIKQTVNNLNQIFEKINNGNGTIGALINDPGLYDQAKALLGGANRNRIIRNLVRQTIKKSNEESSNQGQNQADEKAK